MKRALTLMLALAGCGHLPSGRTRATARLASLSVTGVRRGELQLVARYQLDGLPWGRWRGEQAALTLSFDDIPVAATVAEPRVLPGDQVELPVALVFSRAPPDVAPAWSAGASVRVRLRGRLTLRDASGEARIPTDVEAELVLPSAALPPTRG